MDDEPTPYDTPSTTLDRPAEDDAVRQGLLHLVGNRFEGMMRLFEVGSEVWWGAATAARLIQRGLDGDGESTAQEWAQVSDAVGPPSNVDEEIATLEADADGTEVDEDLACVYARRAVLKVAAAESADDPTRRQELVEEAVESASKAADWAGEGDDWRDGYDKVVAETLDTLTERAEEWFEWDRAARHVCLSRLLEHPDGATADDVNRYLWSGWAERQWDWLYANGMVEHRDVGGKDAVAVTDKGREYLAALCFQIDAMPPDAITGVCPRCGNPAVKVVELTDVDEEPSLIHPVAGDGRIRFYVTCPRPADRAPATPGQAGEPPTARHGTPARPPDSVEVSTPQQLLAVLQAKAHRALAGAESASDASDRVYGELADVIDIAAQCRDKHFPQVHVDIVAALQDPAAVALTAARSAAAAAVDAHAAASSAAQMAARHVDFAARGAAGTYYQGAA